MTAPRPALQPGLTGDPITIERLLGTFVAAQREIATSGPGVAQVAETLAAVAHRLSGRCALVVLLDDDAVEVVGAAGRGEQDLPCGLRFPATPSLSAAALAADQTLVSASAIADP